jgi:hypothetical protein
MVLFLLLRQSMNRVTIGSLAIVAFIASSSPASAGAINFSSAAHASLNAGALFEVPTAVSTAASVSDTAMEISFGVSPAIATDAASALTQLPLVAGEVNFTMMMAGNMGFQYGSDGSAPKLPGGMVGPTAIPEPAALLLLGPAVALAIRRRRRTTTAR